MGLNKPPVDYSMSASTTETIKMNIGDQVNVFDKIIDHDDGGGENYRIESIELLHLLNKHYIDIIIDEKFDNLISEIKKNARRERIIHIFLFINLAILCYYFWNMALVY